MVGEGEKRPPEEAEFDTAELVTELKKLKKLKTNHSQRKADSSSKKKKRWQFQVEEKKKRRISFRSSDARE